MAVYYNDFDPFCVDLLKKHVALGNLPQGDVDGRNIKLVGADELCGYGAVHLCAGIGGFPLGLSWAGITDQFRILTAGWPCQPHSVAGKQRGAADERELWPEILRVIRGYRPRWFLGENVRNILSTDHGRYFGTILRQLAEVGYDAEWQVISASAVGAPHIRERIWIVAYPTGQRPLLWRDRTKAKPTQGAGLSGGSHWADGAVPPELVRMAHGLPNRVDRLHAIGNALVPQIPHFIGQLIMGVENAATDHCLARPRHCRAA